MYEWWKRRLNGIQITFGKLDGFMSNHLEQTGDWDARVQELALFVSSIVLPRLVIIQIN